MIVDFNGKYNLFIYNIIQGYKMFSSDTLTVFVLVI